MTEVTELLESCMNTELSQSESYAPLSPVIGSGQSIKKFIKNRKRHKRDPSKVVQKLEDILKPKHVIENCQAVTEQEESSKNDSALQGFASLENSINIIEPIAGPSNLKTVVSNEHKTIVDRIKELEVLEVQKSNIIKNLSFNPKIPIETQKLSSIAPEKPQEIDKASFNACSMKETCVVPPTGPVCFQTGTGKSIKIPNADIENSKKLFEDILGVSPSQVTRKKKYNYLHKHLNESKTESEAYRVNKTVNSNIWESSNVALSNPINNIFKTEFLVENICFTPIPQGNQFNKAVINLEQEQEVDNFEGVNVLAPKQIKNIFEGESFDDLNMGQNVGFKSASICFGHPIKSKEKQTDPEVSILNAIKDVAKTDKTSTEFSKNIFGEENFDDLNSVQNIGFKPASISFGNQENSDLELSKRKHSKDQDQMCNFKPSKNIFEGENFDDLKSGENIRNKQASRGFGEKEDSNLNLSKDGYNQMCNFKPSKSIFERENFDDLKSGQNIGFKPASRSLGDKGASNLNLNKDYDQMCNVKPSKSIFEGENFDDLNLGQNTGFKPASKSFGDKEDTNLNLNEGNKQMSHYKPSKSIFEGENFDDLNLDEIIGFKPASISFGQAPKTSYEPTNPESTLLNQNKVTSKTKARNVVEGENLADLKSLQNSARTPDRGNISEGSKRGQLSAENSVQAREGVRNIFEDENFDDLNINFEQVKNTSTMASKSTSRNTVNNNSRGFRNIFENEKFDDLNLAGLGPKFPGVVPSKSNLHARQHGGFQSPYKTPTKNATSTNPDDFHGFSRQEQQAAVDVSNDSGQIYKIICERFENVIVAQHETKPLLNLDDIEILAKNILDKNQQQCPLESAIHRINRKRKFSEVDSDHNLLLCQNSTSSVTPLQSSSLKRPKKRLGCHVTPTIHLSETGLKRAKLIFDDLEPKPMQTSTPLKRDGILAKPVSCDLTPILKENAGSSLFNDFSFSKSRSNLESTIIGGSNRRSLHKPSEGDVNVWLESLNYERRKLLERLRIVEEKQTILVNQRTISQYSTKGLSRVIPGVLCKSKYMQSKLCFREYVNYHFPGEKPSGNTFLHQINPQNAHLVHFYICDKRSHVKTEDGAVIVPNNESRIGISEIEHGFKLMNGVDPSLIAKGWIRNHYKWVVWKLASYERMFEDKFEECLSVENVVQQLKYRYDVEIDNVKRPILRKILEKDDCSQRRMILCVSKIIKVNNSYELELTDGWYPIRTVIDLPLSDQIIKGKIKLGVKVMIYGAEMMNCEGCHPLEASDSIYLRINYNATRRALWWCKLGYQKESGPFLIPMSSINMDGGKIGCIRCFISRVYPVKYMEKLGDKSVWRNGKAEERREQDFYNEKFKRLNNSHHSKINVDFKNLKDVQKIRDPEVLYDILQKSMDPEGFQEMLSESQRTIVYNYSINKSAPSNSTFLGQRSVKAVLKIKVADAACDSDIVYDFHIWKPGEEHLQELKEGEIVSIFNVSCSSKWGLGASQTTQFRREAKTKDVRFEKFKRKATKIEELPSFFKLNNLVNEFDTAGLLIKKEIGDFQQIWMADSCQRLLTIRINDSPKNILALDTVGEGQIVSVCNLVMKHCYDTHAIAVADHSVIFARYSLHNHLQDALEELEDDFKRVDRDTFIRDCKVKINQIEGKRHTNTGYLDMDGMECSQITTTDMALLECVEKFT